MDEQESGLALSRTRRVRRQHLLDAGQDLFLHDGYHATTMERVAEAAGVSKVTLYRYFTDKDDLFLTLVREQKIAPNPALVDQTRAAAKRTLGALARGDERAVTEQAILELLQHAGERHSDAFFRLLIEIAFDHPDLLARVRQEGLGPRTGMGRLARMEGLQASLPPELDAEVLVHFLIAVVMGYTIVQPVLLGNDRLTPERLAAGLAVLLTRALEARE